MLAKTLIGDAWIGGDDLCNDNPSDLDTPAGRFTPVGDVEAREAIAAARAAFPAWASASPLVRAEVLDRAGALLAERAADIGQALAMEEGKTLAEAVGEVTRAAQILKFFAGEALRLTGERQASTRPGVDVEITREPLGVVGLVTPWNFPIAIPAWKAAPALAFGNTVVLKPAELTPLSAMALAQALRDAGAPPGVFNLVLGPGSVVGAALVESPEVDAISFTGSVETGRRLAARCASLGKAVQCEMGGKNPLVILADANLPAAVDNAINSAFFSTGQRCTAASRLIVEASVHDEVVERLKQGMAALRIGHALEPATQIGPVVSQAQLNGNLAAIDIARAEGAEIIGGQTLERATRGHYLRPALVVTGTRGLTLDRDEVFGPVASIVSAADFDEALAIANDTPFGLSAGICTTSLDKARAFKRGAQAGMVMVNLPTAGVDPHVPFGGRKASSFGPREQGAYARQFYTSVKTAYVG